MSGQDVPKQPVSKPTTTDKMTLCPHGVNVKHYCELCAVAGKRTSEHDLKKTQLLKILQTFDVHSNCGENNELMNQLMMWGGYVR